MDTLSLRAPQSKSHSHYTYILQYPEDYPEPDKAGTVFYVGKGTNRCRIYFHENEARRGVKSYKCNVIRRIHSYGQQVVKKKVAFFDTNDEACTYEIALIFFMNASGRLTNLTLGGEGTLGAVVSAETRQKKSKATKGRKHSAEHVRKSADAKRGKPLSEETRRKMSLSTKAKLWPGFISPDGVRYENIVNLAAFCREHGLNDSTMNRVSQGKLRQHKGWTALELPPPRGGHPHTPDSRSKIALANSKVWKGFISPDGVRYENIVNLRAFCLEHSLNISCMHGLANGKYAQHKGWKAIP